MSKIIAVTSFRGSSGKTTTALALAKGLTFTGKPTLLIDIDSQANATQELGLIPNSSLNFQTLEQNPSALRSLPTKTGEGFSIIMGNYDLEHTFPQFHDRSFEKKRILAEALQSLQHDFEFIVLDCPAEANSITLSALFAAHRIVIPCRLEYFAKNAIRELYDELDKCSDHFDFARKVHGILPTFLNSNEPGCEKILAELREEYPLRLLPFAVPFDEAIARSAEAGQTVLSYAPFSHAAFAYLRLTESLLRTTHTRHSETTADERVIY